MIGAGVAEARPAIWLDTNVLLRYMAKDDPAQFARAAALFARAISGELRIQVSPEVIAETIWALGSFYGTPRRIAAGLLRDVLSSEAMAEHDRMIDEAVDAVARRDVDPVDALLAARASRRGEQVASFDRALRKLGVELVKL